MRKTLIDELNLHYLHCCVLSPSPFPHALDRKHDIPYLAGYSKDGKTIYIDRARDGVERAVHHQTGDEPLEHSQLPVWRRTSPPTASCQRG